MALVSSGIVQTELEHMASTYASPIAGLPSQMALHTGRATFNEAYALIPNGVMRDIVTSCLPHWRDARAWIIARPLSGFAETFSQYIVEVFPGGGSERQPTCRENRKDPLPTYWAQDALLPTHTDTRR